MRTVKLYGRLAKKYGAEHTFDAKSPAELIRALIANFPGFKKQFSKHRWAMVAGDLKEGRTLRMDDMHFPVSKRERTLHLVPHTYKVAGLDPVTAGIFFAAGGLLVAAVAMVLFAPKLAGPDPNDREKDDKNSFVFDGPVNVTEQGHPVPLVYGRCRVGSVVVSSSIKNTRVVPNTVWDDGLGGLVGDTPGMLGGADWYISKGAKQPRAAVEDPNTLQSQATGRVVDVVSEGEIGGLVDGLKSVYFDDTPVQNADDSYNFKGVEVTQRTGLPDQAYMPGFEAQETSNTVETEVKIVTGPVVHTITNSNIDRARVTIRLPALYKTDSTTGDMKANSVSFKISVQANGGGYVDVITHTFNDKNTAPYDEDFEFALPAGGSPWDIKVTRITADSDDVNNRNQTYFQTITEIIDAKFSYPDTAAMGLVVDARQFGSSIPNRSYLIDGIKVQVPDNYDYVTRAYTGVWGGTFQRAPTSNPAWVVYDMCVNNRYGLGRLLGALPDKFELYTIAQYCDELVDDGYGGTEPRFQINGVINTRAQALEVLRQVCDAFNAVLYANTTKIKIVQDSPADPEKLIVGANTIDGQITYSGTPNDGKYSAWVVAFTDPDDGYRLGYEVTEDHDLMQTIGWRDRQVTRFMCTSRGEAQRFGRKLRDDQRYKQHVANWGAGADHGFLSPGAVVEAADKKFTTQRWGGLVAASTTTSLTIDKAVNIISGRTYTLKVVLPDGTLAEKTLTNSAATGVTVLTWSGALSVAPKKGAVWALNDDLISHRQFRVRSVSERRFGEYDYTAELYDPNKYARIEEGLVIEPATFTDIPSGRIDPPASITVTEFLKENGNASVPTVQVAFPASLDPRATAYDVAYRDPDSATWTPLYGGGILWREFVNVLPGLYDFRVRSKDDVGRVGPWFVLEDQTLNGPEGDSGLPTITGLTLYTDGTNAVFDLRWDKPADIRPFYYEVWRNTVDDFATATLLGTAREERYPISLAGYYWVRTHYMTSVGSEGTSLSVTSGDFLDLRDDLDDLAATIAAAPGIPAVDTLPVSGTENEIVFYTVDDKLYVWHTDAWVPLVADAGGGSVGIETVDTLPSTDNFEGRIVYLTTDGKLYIYREGSINDYVPMVGEGTTGGVIGIETGASLPVTDLFEGRLFYLTTDDNLYRYNGTTWTAGVDAVNVTGTLTDAQIADLAATKITGTLTDTQIADLAATKITGTLTSTQIADLAITGPKIASGAITAAKITAGTITATEIAASTITGAKIAAGTITAANITAGTITATEIAASTITGAKIAAGTITAANILAGTITATEIAASTITGAKIAATTISASNIVSGTITTTQIAAGTIVASNIASGTITATQIASATITGDRLVAGTITASQIASGTITATQIAAATITGDRLVAGTITASQIAASTITSDKINVSTLSAISGNLGTITAGSISIGGGKFQVDTSGNVTIYSATTGQRLTISNSVIRVYDSGGTLRVELGIW